MRDVRGASLKRALKEQGRSQLWLAQVTGYSPAYVSNVLSGARPWTEEFQAKALRVLGAPGLNRELFRGRAIRVPESIYKRRAELPTDVVAQSYEEGWKASWIEEHGATALAVAAERAWRMALATAGGDVV